MSAYIPPHMRLVRVPRVAEETRVSLPRVRKPDNVADFLRPKAALEDVEVFYVLALDSQSKVIAWTELTRGVLNASLVHPREVYRWAIANGAAGIIVAHNHPSGDPTPSPEDKGITSQLTAAGTVLGIPCYDHVIVTHDTWFSFANSGLM